MKVFSSWSGGKDCMLALHKFLSVEGNQLECLVNMCEADSENSRSHGINRNLIVKQAKQLGFNLLQPLSSRKKYELVFKETISDLKAKGVTGGVFGDIYLKEHRVWIERVCKEVGVKPIFPLWEMNTEMLLREFVAENFKTIVVAINSQFLPDEWLGRIIDKSFIKDILELKDIDPCAENGEYHSFVYDGPLFNSPVSFERGTISEKDNHKFLELI